MNEHAILISQYRAVLEMLKQTIIQCPESLWNTIDTGTPFWQIAYHAIFYTHLYIQDSQQTFTPWSKHRRVAAHITTKGRRNVKNVQKLGGFAALYLAVAYAIGIALFLVVLDYPHIVEPAQKVVLLVDKSMVIYFTNLLLYVLFGVFLVVLVLALYERLQAGSSGPRYTRTCKIILGSYPAFILASRVQMTFRK